MVKIVTIHDGGPGMTGPRALKIAGLVVGGLVLAVLFALAFGWAVMALWNWLMPAIFGLGAVSYWQAFGLVILAKILFTGIGRPGMGVGGGRRFGRRGRGFGRDDGPGRGPEDWGRFREYWHDEGRDTFERWMTRKAGGGAGAGV